MDKFYVITEDEYILIGDDLIQLHITGGNSGECYYKAHYDDWSSVLKEIGVTDIKNSHSAIQLSTPLIEKLQRLRRQVLNRKLKKVKSEF